MPNVYIRKIVDRNGKIIEQNDPPCLQDEPVHPVQAQARTVPHETSGDPGINGHGAGKSLNSSIRACRGIDESSAHIMTSLLQAAVQNGTGRILKEIVGRTDVAGKTGTTTDAIDAWFMGFTPDYTCGVWVGFDEKVSLGAGETGARAAAPIWGQFMKEVLKDTPIAQFTPPTSVVEHVGSAIVADQDQRIKGGGSVVSASGVRR